MTRLTDTVKLLTLLALCLAYPTPASADLVVWNPDDVETSISTLFRLDTGDIGDIDDNVLFEAADFQLAPFRIPIPGRPFNRGILAGVRIISTPFPTNPVPDVFTGTGVTTNDFGELRKLAPGELIGANLDFAGEADAYSILGLPFAFDWERGDNGYVGLQLSINEQTHYGWAELTLGAEVGRYTLSRFAYETTPNTAIAAAAVPEPSSFLCLGLMGFLASWQRHLRRRRQPQKASPKEKSRRTSSEEYLALTSSG